MRSPSGKRLTLPHRSYLNRARRSSFDPGRHRSLECAIRGAARAIVTGDRMLTLRDYVST
jgi:hypothetical protein